jgi:hypothetical protein
MAAFRGHRATAKAVARCAAATQRRKARAHSTSRHLSAKLGRWTTVVSKGERADDQSRHRYSAVFVHGRFRDWNRNRRCDLPDLAGQSATPLLVRACWYVDVRRDTRDKRCANVFRADFSCA